MSPEPRSKKHGSSDSTGPGADNADQPRADAERNGVAARALSRVRERADAVAQQLETMRGLVETKKRAEERLTQQLQGLQIRIEGLEEVARRQGDSSAGA